MFRDKDFLENYAIRLKNGVGLKSQEHEIREQAYKLNTTLAEEREKSDDSLPSDKLSDAEILHLLNCLAEWGNKQDKGYWKKQISVS